MKIYEYIAKAELNEVIIYTIISVICMIIILITY
jgi:hypothetical protein